MDHLGHHSLTCKHGGDVVTRHVQQLRDVLVEGCHLAHVTYQVEWEVDGDQRSTG